jgi:O-antigen/teichoic acid export membrane protein
VSVIADKAGRPVASAARRRLELVANRDAALLSIGTVGSGVLAYLFNVVAARAMGPEGYGPVAILWATLFLGAVLLFRPLEQTMSRAVADRVARGEDAHAPARIIGWFGVGVAIAAAIACGAAWGPITDGLFDGHDALTAGLVAGLVGYGASYLMRGLLGGVQWFGGYGLLLLADGGIRVVLGLLLLVYATPAVAAVALAGAAIGGALVPLLARDRVRMRRLSGDTPPRFAIGGAARFAAPAAVVALCEQVLISGGPLLVLVASDADTTTAGLVFAAMLLVRAPVFLFQGVAASLLPSLTTFHARGDHAGTRRRTFAVAGIMAGFAALMTAAALIAGPETMGILYGDGFDMGRGDLALLAVGIGAFLAASTFSQAVLAKARAGGAALAWSAGALAFVALELSLSGSPVHRVALAFAAGSAVVAASMFAGILRSRA